MLLKDNNPWLGLESYSVDDSNRFYGRDEDINVVSNTIYDNFITTIYGISGAGKTSLINAGITPVLKQNGYLPVRIRLKHKSESSYCMQIIETICAAVEAIGGEVEYDGNIELEAIHENEKLWFFLHTRNFWTHDNYPIKPVLFIDQFEEIFTQNSDCNSRIADFFDSISSIQHDTPPTFTKQMLEEEGRDYFDLNMNKSRMVFIIREDFLARLEDYSYGIAALRRNRIGIKRMNGFQALDVIQKPCPGIITDEGAIKILCKVSGKEVNDSRRSLEQLSIDTSILSLFCSELYERAADSNSSTITEEIIEEFGNDIISRFYAKNMALVAPALAEYLEIHLLTSSGFRNSVAYEDIIIPKVFREVIAKGLEILAEKRILRIEDVDGVVRVEFTHDVLCKVAKQHRDSIKEEGEKRSTIIKTVIKTIEQIAIVLITGAFLLTSNNVHIIAQNCFRPDWLLACGLFVTLFFGKKESRSNYVNFGLSVLLSVLLIRIPECWIYHSWITPYRYIIFAISIFLSGWAFFGNKNHSKTPLRMLMAADILLMLLCNRAIFSISLIALPILATMPLKYSEDRNTWKICLIAASVTFLAASISREESFTLLSIYPLLGLLYRRRTDNSVSFKESLSKCLRFEAWWKDRSWMIMFLIIAIFGIFRWSWQISDSKSDTAIIYYTPIVVFLIYCSLTRLRDLIFKDDNAESNNAHLVRNALIISGISLSIVLCQYIIYGFCYMVAVWITVVGLFIWKNCRKITLRDTPKKILLPTAVILACICLIPMHMIGYNVSSYIYYAKAIGKNMTDNDFIVIRDRWGDYGIRDRAWIVISPKYTDIAQKVEHHLWGNTSFPDIIFYVKNDDGQYVEWHCNEHMDSYNSCTESILDCAQSKIFHSEEFDGEYVLRYLSYVDSLFYSTYYESKHAKDIIARVYGHEIGSDKTLDRFNYNEYKERISRLRYYKILSYVDDTEFIDYMIDSVYTKPAITYSTCIHCYGTGMTDSGICSYCTGTGRETTRESQYKLWEYYDSKAKYYIYSNQFEKAEESAEEAMRQDTSLTYGYKNLIIAKVLQNKYDDAYELLEKHGYGMHYMGALMDIHDEHTEMDIIHKTSDECSPLLRYDNLYNGIRNELNSIKQCKVRLDTTAISYKEFEAFIESHCISAYDSAEDKGGYYLCRKYEHFLSPFDEWYMANDYSVPQYKLVYQFYMKDNVEISPAFDTYAEGIREDIMLVIDKDDTKRKFIDRTEDVPEGIPGSFDHAWRFSQGLAAVAVDGKLGFIDKEGNYAIDTLFTYENDPRYGVDNYNRQDCNIPDYTFHQNLCMMRGNNGKYGLINTDGEWVLDPAYEQIHYLNRLSLWLLKDNSSGRTLYGGANTRGKVSIPVEYDKFIYVRDETLGFDHNMLDLYAGYFGKDGNYFEVIFSPSYGGSHYLSPQGYTIRNYRDDFYDVIWEITAPNGRIRTYKDRQVDHTW